MDGGRVGGQVGQLVEDAALSDDGVDQVGVACGKGAGLASGRPLVVLSTWRACWEGEFGGQEGVEPRERRCAREKQLGQGWHAAVCANCGYTKTLPFWKRASGLSSVGPLLVPSRPPSQLSTKGQHLAK